MDARSKFIEEYVCKPEAEMGKLRAELARRVVAAEKLVDALEFAADKLDDYSPFTGNAIETPYSAHIRQALTAYREASK